MKTKTTRTSAPATGYKILVWFVGNGPGRLNPSATPRGVDGPEDDFLNDKTAEAVTGNQIRIHDSGDHITLGADTQYTWSPTNSNLTGLELSSRILGSAESINELTNNFYEI